MSTKETIPAGHGKPAPNQGEEARRHARIQEPPIHVSGPRVSVLNISMGGIALLTGETLDLGAKYELILTDAWHYFTNELRAEVVWTRGERAGLEWIELTDEQERWLQTRFDDWLNTPQAAVLQRLKS